MKDLYIFVKNSEADIIYFKMWEINKIVNILRWNRDINCFKIFIDEIKNLIKEIFKFNEKTMIFINQRKEMLKNADKIHKHSSLSIFQDIYESNYSILIDSLLSQLQYSKCKKNQKTKLLILYALLELIEEEMQSKKDKK